MRVKENSGSRMCNATTLGFWLLACSGAVLYAAVSNGNPADATTETRHLPVNESTVQTARSTEGSRVLSAEEAERLIRSPDWLTLNDVTALSDAAAAVLARHNGDVISLDGLKSLSDEAALSLAQFKGSMLSLNGLTTLSARGLAALEKNPAAQVPQRAKGSIDTLDLNKAVESHQNSPLNLNHLKELSTQEAKVLSMHSGQLQLNGIRQLSDDAAAALSPHNGDIRLDGLESLSRETAIALARSNSFLFLNGIRSLAPDVATHLAKCKGGLCLNGLTSLSAESAGALVRNGVAKATLSLGGLRDISTEVAEVLGDYKGPLFLHSLAELTPLAAKAVAKHRGTLILNGLASMSEEAAAALGKHAGGALQLNGIRELTPATARGLASHGGDLFVNGVSALPAESLGEFDKFPHSLFIGGPVVLTPEHADALGEAYAGPVLLRNVRVLEEETAARLARSHRGVSLAGLLLVSESVKNTLASHSLIVLPSTLKTVPVPFVWPALTHKHLSNSLGMPLTHLPAGSFLMGSPKQEKGRSSDEKQVSVTLSSAFLIGTTEVTQGQWRTLMGSTPWLKYPDLAVGDNVAASGMTWEDAVSFCDALTLVEHTAGYLPSSYTYAIPTEAQWEYACRAGSERAYCYGDDTRQLRDYSWCGAAGAQGPQAVAGKIANDFGIYDMHGNVFEWCVDVPHSRLRFLIGGTNPVTRGNSTSRIIRGGCWSSPDSHTRAAARFTESTDGSGSKTVGLRIVLREKQEEDPADITVSERKSPATKSVSEREQPKSGASEETFRKWVSADGKRTQEAAYEGQDQGRLIVRLRSGKRATLPISSLSAQDQEFISSRSAAELPLFVEVEEGAESQLATTLGNANRGDSDSTVLTNCIGMKLARIPAGEFDMGSEDTVDTLTQLGIKTFKAVDTGDERPVHRVAITEAFEIGRHEVTVGQFRQFCDEAKYTPECVSSGTGGMGFDLKAGFARDRRYTPWSWGAMPEQTDNHPVVNVTYADANAFCTWLSKKDARTYRLPTEAEWEYSCRAGSTSRFAFGDDPDDLLENGCTGPFTCQVGQYKPNAWGLYDTHGNAAEWCSDWYDSSYYNGSAKGDPTGPPTGKFRSVRGGDHWLGGMFCRSAARWRSEPSNATHFTGFRVVRELGQSKLKSANKDWELKKANTVAYWNSAGNACWGGVAKWKPNYTAESAAQVKAIAESIRAIPRNGVDEDLVAFYLDQADLLQDVGDYLQKNTAANTAFDAIIGTLNNDPWGTATRIFRGHGEIGERFSEMQKRFTRLGVKLTDRYGKTFK